MKFPPFIDKGGDCIYCHIYYARVLHELYALKESSDVLLTVWPGIRINDGLGSAMKANPLRSKGTDKSLYVASFSSDWQRQSLLEPVYLYPSENYIFVYAHI